jgi:hypothetical protein
MRTRFTAVLALLMGLVVVLLPTTASAEAPATESADAQVVVEPKGIGFDVAVYNGTGRKMYVSSAGHNDTPTSDDTETLYPGEWSDEATGIADVDQLRVPGCDVFVQLHWYDDGEWAQVHGFSPVVWAVDVNC